MSGAGLPSRRRRCRLDGSPHGRATRRHHRRQLGHAHAFAKDGNALLLIARHMKMPEGLPADRTICAEADVADYAALEKAIRTAEARFGKTAYLINSA